MKLNSVQRFIFSLAAFLVCLVLAIVFADGVSGGEMNIKDTWGVWLAFILFQAWFQIKVWEKLDEYNFYEIKFPAKIFYHFKKNINTIRDVKIDLRFNPKHIRFFLYITLLFIASFATIFTKAFIDAVKSKQLHLNTNDSPFEKCFGEDSVYGNVEVVVNNKNSDDVIILLVALDNDETIRNKYIRANEHIALYIPPGDFKIITISGNRWNSELYSPCNSRGYFEGDLQRITVLKSYELGTKYYYDAPRSGR